MRRIAIITSNYMPNPDANGICVYNIINELKKFSDEIICICNQNENEAEQEIIDGIKVYRVEPSLHTKLIIRYQKHASVKNKITMEMILNARRVKNLLNIKKYPRTELRREKMILSILEKLPEVDLIIAVFRPFDGIGAAIAYKKKYPACKICGYFLDSLNDSVPHGMNPKIYRRIIADNEKKYLEKMDIILKPESDKKYYDKSNWHKKIKYAKFPVFVKASPSEQYPFPKEEISLVFAGTLSSSYRSPIYLLKVLERLYQKNNKIHLHFFGTYDNPAELNHWEKEYMDFFTYHGSISFEQSRSVLASADILVNITNKGMDMVPSKIYELMAQGKPILNVRSNKEDICEKYFGVYPLLCNVDGVEMNIAEDAAKVERFFKCSDNKMDYQRIYQENYMATPAYVCGIIYDQYQKLCK